MIFSQQLLICSLCGGTTVEVGQILHQLPTKVAGVSINLPDPEYHLRKCENCTFMFKSPAIPANLLNHCYEESSFQQWGEFVDVVERSFERFKRILIDNCVEGNVLDVGCFTGSLLHYLGDQWGRFGIEPSTQAKEVATRKGVKIIGNRIEDILDGPNRFDAVFTVDVLEHLSDPKKHLKDLLSLLKPNGLLVLSTGNTESYPWKIFGSRYWYTSLPEHLSFYNPTCLEKFFNTEGVEVRDVQLFPHCRGNLYRRSMQMIRSMVYLTGLTLSKAMPLKLTPAAVNRASPGWVCATDHMIVTASRRAVTTV